MTGTKRENTGGERQLKIGWTESKVISACPTTEELGKIGIDVDEEPEYIKENKEGTNVARIDFWMEDVKSGYKYKRSFFLEDSVSETKAKEGEEAGFKKKTQYINQVGESGWAESKKDLQARFTKFRKKVKGTEDEYEEYGDKSFRVAKKGEADLMAFIKMWLSGCNFYDVDTNILLDMKKIFNGNFKEIKEQVGGELAIIEKGGKEYPSTICEVLEVKTVDGEEGVKEYQSVWRRSVPGWLMKTIRNTQFTKENIAKWLKEGKRKDNPDGTRWLKDHEKLAVEISLGEYKSKNFYSLEPLHDYNSEENFVTGEKPKKQGITEENDSY